ncbi:MAG: MFS transporter [Gammaproteobacteria bacterium]
MTSQKTENQFQLLTQKRFGWFFTAQFLGAFNDNLFKMALIILISFELSTKNPDLANMLASLCTGAFVLPFFLFSAFAGQIADKFDKATLIRWIKCLEILITSLAAIAFHKLALNWLVVLLMLMGSHSALFGPVKYSYLPKQLHPSELIGGNGLVEMGTFLAILIGTLLGGVLIGIERYGTYVVAATTITVAVMGWGAATQIPSTPSESKHIRINFNFISEIYYNLKLAAQNPSILLYLFAISWFWFLGASFLTQIGNYTAHYVHGTPAIVSLLIGAFSIGIGLGALSCEKLSNKKIEKGLVPFGAIGMAFFILDYSLVHLTFPSDHSLVTTQMFFQYGAYWHLLFSQIGLGLFGGIYIVPLYAMIQHHSPPEICSRIIAANNLLNALFMVFSSIIAIGMFSWSFTIYQLFFVILVLHIAVLSIIFWIDRDLLKRFKAWLL